MIKYISIIFITSFITFLIYQIWFFVENYDYIVNFNTKYSNIEYISNPSSILIDNNVFMDNITNSKQKQRCITLGNIWYFASIDGYVSTTSTEKTISYNTFNDCVNMGFAIEKPYTIFNPCLVNQNDNGCITLKALII